MSTDQALESFERWRAKGKKKKEKAKGKATVKKKPWEIEKEIIAKLQQKYKDIDPSSIQKFTDLPLSRKTQQGLQAAGYKFPTDVQKNSVHPALLGRDILGAAKTGSGKTLAFLLPVLESLWRLQWSQLDGLGALIITPTRELAYQIFEVLRKVGKKHDFSAGLVIGGKDVRAESEQIYRTNIVICTPGRLLQHMDETAYFEANNLQLLVLDEADRILDLGFAATMNAIIQNLPTTRQTMLFSATQTKSVKDLARLSLKNPVYISVHEHHKFSTPQKLKQSYLVCELHQKLDLLFSFIKNHLRSKILVFLSSCKQVRYVYEAFCRLQPGMSVLCLHGKMPQMKRVDVYNSFCRKQHVCLLATDIAARGLDFPAVHWVLQLDCPEDADTYIHRAGRTARYESDGESLLVLMPSEERQMLQQLTDKKIPVEKIRVNPSKFYSIQNKLEVLCAQDVHIKESAQKCFVSYLRSYYLQPNKQVFDVNKLPLENYSSSLGLAVAPRVRFLQNAAKGKEKAASKEQTTSGMGDKHTWPQGEEDAEKAVDTDKQLVQSKTVSHADAEKYHPLETTSKADDSGERTAGESSDSEVEQTKTKSLLERTVEVGTSQEGELSESASGESEDEDEKGQGTKGMLLWQQDDEEEDLLTVKKRDVFNVKGNIQEAKVLEIEKSSSNEKKTALTKAKLAKKLAKKKVKVNSKVKFDDEGEVAEQWPPVQKVVLKGDVGEEEKEEEEEEEVGGLNLETARKLMQEEDKHDKLAYKQRIRQKKWEKKMKLKEASRSKDQQRRKTDTVQEEGVAYLDVGEEEEDGDSAEDAGSDSESDQGSDVGQRSDSGSEEEDVERPRKRRKHTRSSSDEEDDDLMDTGLDLQDDEELALHLLGSN
ncbi:DDX10 [Branchiostoma lanceolatum]|uniref:ATP-dependent RNA helicase n=1 Tax=Branchiostoma lanceolatum TaxID=7740 RepID=A0A8J9YI21_BRALA|nr:DDX10 [Branchiostoma lanceolatum]